MNRHASNPRHQAHRRPTMMIDMYKAQSKIRKWVVIRKVSWRGRHLHDLPRHYRDNADVVRAAVSQDSRALIYASDRLRDDKKTVMAAMKRKCMIISSSMSAYVSETTEMLFSRL